jgi:hypothetical protein
MRARFYPQNLRICSITAVRSLTVEGYTNNQVTTLNKFDLSSGAGPQADLEQGVRGYDGCFELTVLFKGFES